MWRILSISDFGDFGLWAVEIGRYQCQRYRPYLILGPLVYMENFILASCTDPPEYLGNNKYECLRPTCSTAMISWV
jgi:hypothetical protein